MSEIEPKQEVQKPQKNQRRAPAAKPRSKARQNQLSSIESELNTTETTLGQNSQLALQPSDNEAEGVERLPTDFKHQDQLEARLTKAHHNNKQTGPELLIATADYLTTPQQAKTFPSSQQSHLTLETIHREQKLLREDMQKLQTSIESKLQEFTTQFASLREEVTVLNQQQTVTTELLRGQIDRESKQVQSNNAHLQPLNNKQTRGKKHEFNAVAYLQEHGEALLWEELEKKAKTELGQIVRSENIKIGKGLKSLEREEMIKEIILNAERRLKQGSVFLKN